MTQEQIKMGINLILDKLVSPKYGAKVNYDVEILDDDGDSRYWIDVLVDADNYEQIYNKGDYDSPDELDEDISYDVKRTLMYLGINKSIVDVYAV